MGSSCFTAAYDTKWCALFHLLLSEAVVLGHKTHRHWLWMAGFLGVCEAAVCLLGRTVVYVLHVRLRRDIAFEVLSCCACSVFSSSGLRYLSGIRAQLFTHHWC